MYFFAGINVLFTSATNLYFYCYGGDVATRNFAQYADSLFNVDWYKTPNHLQKFFILMIAETQRPLRFEGYRIIDINLNAFTNVRFFFIC